MERLTRKIDFFLRDWRNRPNHKPLIVKGARQVGKTEAIEFFAKKNYPNFIKVNFIEQPQYKTIFDNGFEVEKILKNMSIINPELEFTPNETLLFFDELQDCPNAATALKFFREDGRFDVICSGSMMGINYQEIESNSVGNKEDYEMHSLDFEEFLWAKGYNEKQINDLYQHMLEVQPFSQLELDVMFEIFRDYMVLGGMPEIVFSYITNKTFEGVLKMQKQILSDYREDITKYAKGMEKARILNVYEKVPAFLGNENKKFQISKVEYGARTREYIGSVDWLNNAGIINISYCMAAPSLPL